MFSLFNIKKIQHSSDEELMLFIQKGDEKAFNELYKRYARKMHYYFYRLLYSDNDKADDFVQDLFMKIIEKPESYNSSLKFSSWLYAVANNMCKNEYRWNAVRGPKIEVSEWQIAEEEFSGYITNKYDKELFKKHLEKTLTNLEPDQSLTFVLRYQEHLSIKEISQVMNCSEGTVKSRIFYTLKKIASSMTMFANG